MEKNSNRGKFIVFEGTDGSGKSTQIRLLAEYLTSQGIPCRITREPTDSPFGSLLRSCLTGKIETDEYTIAAMFAADRLDHINNPVSGIIAKLNAGINVLCDRYYFSSFAYNGGLVPLDWVIALNTPARETLRPDLTIYISLSTEEAMKRVGRRNETERYETAERQELTRKKYEEVFARFPEENIAIVESRADKYETQAKIREIVLKELGE